MPATATAERPAAFTSAARANLAGAIDRHRQLAAHLDDVRQRARSGIDARLSEAYNARAAAEAALKDAEASAGSSALARVLGDADAGKSVAQLQVELKAARDHFDAVWADRELVNAEIARLGGAVANAARDRDAAITKVLDSEPAWRSLLAELPAARLRVQMLENLFDVIGKLPGTRMPAHWDTPLLRDRPQSWLPDPALATSWSEAIAALQSDASAALPGDDD
jgi:hypothetical protein